MSAIQDLNYMTKIFRTSSENKIIFAAFTRNGINLALRISQKFNGRIFAPERFHDSGPEIIEGSLSEWAGNFFHVTDAFIFIGACGIAVRAISKHIDSKLSDPAVIVIDESGKYVIPVLSGHIGGANELAKNIAVFLNAQAVITTATDVNNIIAVDEWAMNNNFMIENLENIKHVSSRLLENNSVGVAVTDMLLPAPFHVTLWLRPKILILGAGCNRNTDPEEFEESAKNFLDTAGFSVHSLKALTSIEIKANEPALILFAKKYNIDFITFKASELQALTGNFTRSEKVLRLTGADNICERSCMLAAGKNAALLRNKCIYGGITFALSRVRTEKRDDEK